MREDVDKLEREVDAALADWADRLDVEPSEAAVARTREFVRLELNEAWLTDQPTPSPSPHTLAEVRTAVRAELRKVRGQKRLWRWAPLAAAAAIIVIGVGLFQHMRFGEEPQPLINGEELFVYVADTVFAEDPALSAIETELMALEESIDQFSLTGDFYQSELDSLGDEVDAFETTLDSMSHASGDSQGVLG